MQIRILLPILILLQMACQEAPVPVPPPAPQPDPKGEVAVFRTNAAGTIGLAQADSLPAISPTGEGLVIPLDPDETYQEMEGFGAALTESSAYVLKEHLSASKRQEVLTDLFSQTEGIGISYIRLTMGASDFSLDNYTYNDLPSGQKDINMDQFSLTREEAYLIPVLQEILAISPDLCIMATPWSAPAWMKSNQSILNGGELTSEFYPAYAHYFISYLEAMEATGIPIRAITIQNEPLHQAGYPSMRMTAADQLVFIRDHLGPALEQAGLETEIIIYDHNWDEVDYPLDILDDPAAKAYVAGTAFHCYAGDVSAMTQLHQAHPDRGIYFTECSGGGWSPDFGSNLAWNMENLMIGAPRNWGKTVLMWNLALDENSGPQNGGCSDCRGVITVNAANGSINRNVEYYLLGHSARFVRPGARRIKSPDTRGQGVSQIAYQNADQSRVLLAYNHLDQAVELEVLIAEDQAFAYLLEPGMLATFSWE